MREQVITPRAGRGGAGANKQRAGDVAQRPAKRASSSRAKAGGWRKVLVYLPVAGKLALAVIACVLLFAGYRAAASASFFRARTVDISGASRVSSDEVRAIVRERVAQTGVWSADLDAISRELKKITWVREAVVSRVLPDGLRVRITERTPRAVVRTGAGKFVWVDEDAVGLGPAAPTDQIFMRGWDEDETEGARAQNRERVEKFLEMTRDWEARGISRRVSEVSLYDLGDVRAQLTGEDADIEIQLGREDFGNRLKFALDELDVRRNTPIGPFILYINVAQGIEKGTDHMSIGVRPDAPNFRTGEGSGSGPEVESAKVERPKPAAKPKPEGRKAKEKENTARKDDARERKREAEKKKAGKDKKEKEPGQARTEGRPRRVG